MGARGIPRRFPGFRLGLALLATLAGALPSAAGDFSLPLPIPPLAERREAGDGTVLFELTARRGSRDFLGGLQTPTYGYNGDYLGPTLRVRRGERVRIRVRNSLEEATTVHWHGLEVPGPADGGPHQPIAPGGLWEPEFAVDQPAATLWYHPHPIGRTAEQVYRGLAGLFLIEEAPAAGAGPAAVLPGRYGIDDIPVIIQDRRFYDDGRFAYRLGMPELMHGLLGDVFLVNGAVRPMIEVHRGIVRLRLLNGSSSSIYRLSLSDGATLHQIASDGGLLPAPVDGPALILSAGERAEVLLDLRARPEGESFMLRVETYGGFEAEVLRFVVGSAPAGSVTKGIPSSGPAPSGIPPAPLAVVERLTPGPGARVRRFELQTLGGGRGGMGGGMMGGMMGSRLSINGRKMDMGRVDFTVTAGRTEVWELTNPPGGMMSLPHSFHVHGVQFQVLDVDGGLPPPELLGWKDTILVWPGERIRLALRFPAIQGLYMYHCHLLEHEDDGMMGQFRLEL